MNGMFQGIVSLWDAASLDSTISGGIYFGEAPQRTSWPYSVMNLITSVPRSFTSSGRINTEIVRIDLWYLEVTGDDPVEQSGILMRAIDNVMNNGAIVIAGEQPLEMRRVAKGFVRDARSIYHGWLDYRLLVKESLSTC